jgi:hypothetical protein
MLNNVYENYSCSLFIYYYYFLRKKSVSLQDLTVLPTEFFRRCKTHIPSVINLPMEMLRR